MKKKRYYTWAHNIEMCLRNGSFVRTSKLGHNGLSQYMNGDFMGFIESVPGGMTEVEQSKAEKLIPACCGK